MELVLLLRAMRVWRDLDGLISYRKVKAGERRQNICVTSRLPLQKIHYIFTLIFNR